MVNGVYELVDHVNIMDNSLKTELDQEKKEKLEQFFTSKDIAIYMAKLLRPSKKRKIRILDPGAGIGMLSAALLNIILKNWKYKPIYIELICYEIDYTLNKYLLENYNFCKNKMIGLGIHLDFKIINENFMVTGYNNKKFDYVILNPPYKKIDGSSELKKHLLGKKIIVPNEYAAFVLISKDLLVEGGGLVAITPRSFCNGQYYGKFREDLLSDSTFKDIHLYELRNSLFKEDSVLQENIVYHILKKRFNYRDKIAINYSSNEKLDDLITYEIDYAELVHPYDEANIIRVLKSERDKEIVKQMEKFTMTIDDLNMSVSTGPFVDFREGKELKSVDSELETFPYIFPEHFDTKNKRIQWPKKPVKKFNYIKIESTNIPKFRPFGSYVLVKRITAKEEQKRIVASVIQEDYSSNLGGYNFLAFDNKVNYFHMNRNGLDKNVALGLCLFLNSTIVDLYFRLFSGHTQVNVSDLRKLKYPSIKQLQFLGGEFQNISTSQEKIDYWVSKLYKI